MGAGDSQVIMVELFVQPSVSGQKTLATVTLRYEDVFGQRQREINSPVLASIRPIKEYYVLEDIEVRRNATILASAEALQDIDRLFNQGHYQKAWELAYQMEGSLRSMAALSGDAQLIEDADLFQRYQITLAEALGYDPSYSTDQPSEEWGDQEQRWGTGDDFPTVEVR
jgi:hypothetical protein